MNDNKDAFDLWWAWAEKPLDGPLTIAAIHDAVIALPPDERRGRAKVNMAARDGLRLGRLRPGGSADLYGVPKPTKWNARQKAPGDRSGLIPCAERGLVSGRS